MLPLVKVFWATARSGEKEPEGAQSPRQWAVIVTGRQMEHVANHIQN